MCPVLADAHHESFSAATRIAPAKEADRVKWIAAGLMEATRGLPTAPLLAPSVADLLLSAGRCREAEALLADYPPPTSRRDEAIDHAGSILDRACANRLITILAGSAEDRAAGDGRLTNLHLAGALWRRIGEEGKGSATLAESERLLLAYEAVAGPDVYSCHGAPCPGSPWLVRLEALRIYHGSPLYKPALDALAERAIRARANAKLHPRAARGSLEWVPNHAIEALIHHAVGAGDLRLARRLEPLASLHGLDEVAAERMRQLFGKRRYAEALSLWPAAGLLFQIDHRTLAAAAASRAFYPYREQFGSLATRNAAKLHVLLTRSLIDRGDGIRARGALASATAHSGSAEQWDQAERARLHAYRAQIEAPTDPQALLAAQQLAEGSGGSDTAFAELAVGLAVRGNEAAAVRALARTRDTAVRDHALAELPCRLVLAAASDTRLERAIAFVILHRSPSSSGEASQEHYAGSWRTFLCLIEAGRHEAAVAWALAQPEANTRFSLLTGFPDEVFASDRPNWLARRLADQAIAMIDADPRLLTPDLKRLAAACERLGERRRVERILRTAKTAEDRFQLYRELLQSHLKG